MTTETSHVLDSTFNAEKKIERILKRKRKTVVQEVRGRCGGRKPRHPSPSPDDVRLYLHLSRFLLLSLLPLFLLLSNIVGDTYGTRGLVSYMAFHSCHTFIWNIQTTSLPSLLSFYPLLSPGAIFGILSFISLRLSTLISPSILLHCPFTVPSGLHRSLLSPNRS